MRGHADGGQSQHQSESLSKRVGRGGGQLFQVLRGWCHSLPLEEDHPKVSHQDEKEDDAIKVTEPQVQSDEEDQKEGGSHQHPRVSPDQLFAGGDGPDECRTSEDEPDVEDVGPDDVTDGNLVLALEGRDQSNPELGCRSPERHHRESHHQLRHAKTLSDGNG